ncbi:MAG: hypothetical protein H7177_16010 [Rhizobacter sp.]|nr:hypothetical protein [Bacteriovorax sp.]
MFFKSKYFFSLFTFLILISGSVDAYDGVVIVLEAPLLRGPSLRSTVIQTIRKGERVYIPREVVIDGTLPEFVPTFDRAGNRAYIPGRYVKVILGTVAENRLPITLPDHDPTDYRIEEPIPATYPFEARGFLRASVAVQLANSTKSPYAYNSTFNQQDYGTEAGVRFTVMKKVDHDKYDRFYFGLLGLITSAENTISFKNNSNAKESRGYIRGGPWFTYDAFKNEKYRMTLGTGFTFNYNRSTILVKSTNGASEERVFAGYSISPVVSPSFQISDIFPYTDLIGGMDLSVYLPSTLTSKEEAVVPELWGESNQISSGLKAQASLYLGIQVKY